MADHIVSESLPVFCPEMFETLISHLLFLCGKNFKSLARRQGFSPKHIGPKSLLVPLTEMMRLQGHLVLFFCKVILPNQQYYSVVLSNICIFPTRWEDLTKFEERILATQILV